MIAAAQITDAERIRAIKYLEETQERYARLTSGLTEAQWKFKPAPERWSMAEIAEHLVVVEEVVFQQMKDALNAPTAPEKKNTRRPDELIVRVVPDRSRKVQAPEPVVPAGRFTSSNETIAAFRKARGATIEFAQSSQADLRSHFVRHFALGDLDIYQWLLFLPAHAERHLKQMEEVQADPAFPKP
jgi:hypothetical protein